MKLFSFLNLLALFGLSKAKKLSEAQKLLGQYQVESWGKKQQQVTEAQEMEWVV